MTPLRNFLLATTGALAGWASVMLASSSACTHQLTVEEADGSIAASCAALAQLMTKDQPEIVDQVVAQVCQPGRTREQIARIVSKLSEGSGVRGSGSGSETEILEWPSEEWSSTDAGAR